MEDNTLKKIYYDPKTGYSGALELYRRAKKVNATMTLKRVKEFLAKQETAQVFKGTNKKKTHLHIEARRGSYQIDHTFMSNRKINNGYHAIFCAVEIGSRWAFVCPMKNIRHEAVLDAFEKLYEATRKLNPVLRIITDEGVEFGSNAVKAWLAEKGIKHRILHHDYHYYSNSIVERFNLTLKQKLMKYVVANKSKKWVDALEDVVYAYNRSKHSYHGERPKDVAKNPITQLIHRIKTIQSNLNLKAKKDFILNQIKTGTKIRLLRKVDKAFSKKIQKYSRKTYTVEGITKNRTMVQIDGKARMIRPWEIQKVDVVESNPTPRVVKSPDVETALANARKAHKEGKTSKRKVKDPIVQDFKKTKEVSQSMVGKWIHTDKNGETYEGKIIRSTTAGHWIELFYKGKRYEHLVRKEEPFEELTTPPKPSPVVKTVDNDLSVVLGLGTSIDLEGIKFKITRKSPTSKWIILKRYDNNGEVISVEFNGDVEEFKSDARIALFLKRFDWKTHAIAITTEEEKEDYWLAKPYGKAKKADADISKRSGGEIPVGWICMPIQWYESVKPLTYKLSKAWHMLDLNHAIRVPNIVLQTDSKNKQFSISIDDDKRIKEQIQRQKNE